MSITERVRTRPDAPTGRLDPVPWWLWFSVPIAVLGVASSLTGIFVDDVYARETPSWRAEAVGQDIANLVVLPVLLVLGYAAARGSLKAFLVWLGTVVYTAYTFAIYAFDVHFGPLFLVHVTVFGLAVWALVGGLGSVEPRWVGRRFVSTPLGRFAPALLVVTAVLFALLWLSEDVPAMIENRPSATLVDAGLLTNPVHVLDLSLFLPVTVLAGVLLRRGHAWGHVLAPMVLTAMAAISAGIVSLIVVNLARGLDGSPVVAAVIGTLGVVQLLTCRRLLQGLAPGARLAAVLRDGQGIR
jgi:hypothetical protein